MAKIKKQPQSEAFIKAARELGCDEDPAHFDAALKKVARHKPAPDQQAQNGGDDDRQYKGSRKKSS